MPRSPTFEFPPKRPNSEFRLSDLNDAVSRLVDYVWTQHILGMDDAGPCWDAERFTEVYWPGIRDGMELIWSRLPEDSRRLYQYGYESYFEGFEDFLGEVKHLYFEIGPNVPRFPMHESIRKRLEQYADVLKGCPEPVVH